MLAPGNVELKLVLGTIKSMSELLHVDQKTIRKIWYRKKIWHRMLANFNNPDIKSFISSPKNKGNFGHFFV
jgi:hypothetical protein